MHSHGCNAFSQLLSATSAQFGLQWQSAPSPVARGGQLPKVPTRLFSELEESKPFCELSVTIGDDFEPLKDISMSTLGTSLVPLQLKHGLGRGSPFKGWLDSLEPGSAHQSDENSDDGMDLSAETMLGVLCEVRLQRGGRQLTVKSCVEIFNESDVPVHLALGNEQSELVVNPGKMFALPLKYTLDGSDTAIKQLKVRPSGQYKWCTLDEISTSTFVACSSIQSIGRPWIYCVRVDSLPLAHHSSATPSSLSTGRESTGRERAQLQCFNLPTSETLLHHYSCFRLTSFGRPQTRCLLYLTRSWMCVYETLYGPAERVRWEEINLIQACSLRHTIVPNSIELLLNDGRQLLFGGLLQREGAQIHIAVSRAV